MWVFDGEEWTDEGGGTAEKRNSESRLPRFDEETPELQVIEILPVRPSKPAYPPLPLIP